MSMKNTTDTLPTDLRTLDVFHLSKLHKWSTHQDMWILFDLSDYKMFHYELYHTNIFLYMIMAD